MKSSFSPMKSAFLSWRDAEAEAKTLHDQSSISSGSAKAVGSQEPIPDSMGFKDDFEAVLL